jgi:preprotein translocase subunit SecG
MEYLLMILMLLTAVFLILLILIQRGRGGGLAGAFGGLGGQSAFGTKAGDVFTKITIYVAFFWIVLCVFSVKYLGSSGSVIAPDLGRSAQPAGTTAPDNKPGAAASTQKDKDSKSADEPTGKSAADAPAASTKGAGDDAKSSGPAEAEDKSSGDSK